MKVIKVLLFYLGVFITLICLILPLYTTCEVRKNEEFIQLAVLGKDHFTYYLSLFFLGVILYTAYVRQNSITVVLILSIIGGGITLFYNWIGQAGFGKPCGHSPTKFQYLLFLGHLMIVVSSLLNVYIKKNNRM